MSAKHALLVDDSKSARFALRQVLQRKGFEVEMAESAEVALEKVGQTQVDAIFMDHMMPGMDGYEAARILKNDPASAHIPIVMCTSNDQEEYVRKARETGAVGILPKPPTLEKLTEIMQLVETEMAQAPANAPQATTNAAPPTTSQAAASAPTTQDIDALIRAQLPGLLHEAVTPVIEQTVTGQLEGLRQQLANLQSQVAQAGPDEAAIAPLIERTVTGQVEGLRQQLATLQSQVAQASPDEAAMVPLIERTVTERIEDLRQQLADQHDQVTQADSDNQAVTSETELREDIAQAVSALRAELTGNYQVYFDDRQRESADRIRNAIDERVGVLSQELHASVRQQIEAANSGPGSDAEIQSLVEQTASAQAGDVTGQLTAAVQEAKDTIAVAMLEQTNAQLDKRLRTVNRKVLAAAIGGGLVTGCCAMLFFLVFGG